MLLYSTNQPNIYTNQTKTTTFQVEEDGYYITNLETGEIYTILSSETFPNNTEIICVE